MAQQGAYFDASPIAPQLFDWLKNYMAGKTVNEYEQKLATGDYTPVEQSIFIDPLKTVELNKDLRTRKDALEALPLQKIQTSLFNDPQFRTTEGMKELQNDPAFWLGLQNISSTGERTKGSVPYNPLNTLTAKIVPETAMMARTTGDIASMSQALADRGNLMTGKAPASIDPFALASSLQTKEGQTAVDKLLEVQKRSTEQRKLFDLQNQLVGFANIEKDPARKAALLNTAQNATSSEEITNMMKTLGYDVRNLNFGQVGVGGELEQSVARDPITGEVVQKYGAPTSKVTSKTNLQVSNYLPKELAKGVVDKFGKDAENLQSVQKQQESLGTMFEIVKNPNNKTGLGQTSAMQAKRALAAFGVNTEGLTNQQLLGALNTQLAAIATRQTDAQPSQKQVELMRESYPGLTMQQATNMALIQNAMNSNSRQISEHNARIDSLKTASPNDYETIKGLYGIKDPGAKYQQQDKGSGTAKDYIKKRFGR